MLGAIKLKLSLGWIPYIFFTSSLKRGKTILGYGTLFVSMDQRRKSMLHLVPAQMLLKNVQTGRKCFSHISKGRTIIWMDHLVRKPNLHHNFKDMLNKTMVVLRNMWVCLHSGVPLHHELSLGEDWVASSTSTISLSSRGVLSHL